MTKYMEMRDYQMDPGGSDSPAYDVQQGGYESWSVDYPELENHIVDGNFAKQYARAFL
jgi:hypothetical protein